MEPTRSEVDNILSTDGLESLVDLQKFFENELGKGDTDLAQAFTPLTNGLGIQVEFKDPPPPRSEPNQSDEFKAPARPLTRLIVDDAFEATRAEQAWTGPEMGSDYAMSPPPPVPVAHMGKRFLAGLVDQCFVWTATLLAIAITSNAMSQAPGELATRLLKDIGNPAFLQAVVLEFAMIWFAYLVLSFGIVEMTFGMWVWGLRVDFGREQRFFKKTGRVLLGLLFYPLVLPTLCLVFRRSGRHLIDGLTKSFVYRTGA